MGNSSSYPSNLTYTKNKLWFILKSLFFCDKVRYKKQLCFIFGRRQSGYFDLRLLDGTKIYASANFKKLELTESADSLLMEVNKGVSSHG